MSRGETSHYLQICIIGLNVAAIKEIRDLERLFPRLICPFCPVFLAGFYATS